MTAMIWLTAIFGLTPFSADRVEILRDEGLSVVHLIGNVVIQGETRKITCHEAYLHESEDYVTLKGNVIVSDDHGRILSSEAKFLFGDQRGFMRGGVTLERPDETITADSLYYDAAQSRIEMFRNVRIDDKKNTLTVIGDRGDYDLDREEGVLSGNPRLAIAREDKDSMTITARTFKLMVKQDEFHGLDSVIAKIDSIVIFCDTFLYDLKSEKGVLANPRVVEKGNYLSGRNGLFVMENDEIRTFNVQQAWSRYHDSEGSKNIVHGEVIAIEFDDGQARRITVTGNPKGALYLKAEDDTDNAGN